MKKTRYALVGTGYFGVALARGLNSLENAEIRAILEHNDNHHVAEEFGCEMEKDLESLCSREDIDA